MAKNLESLPYHVINNTVMNFVIEAPPKLIAQKVSKMTTPSITVLLISDLHYVNNAQHECKIERRKSKLAKILLQKVFWRLKHMQVVPDVALLLGDLVDNGLAEGADGDLAELIKVMNDNDIKYLAASGNHDVKPDDYAKAFNCQPGLHKVGDYGFLVFNDSVGEKDVTTRQDDFINLPQSVSKEHPDMPLIALQHNPIFPDIECEYPYMPTNVAGIKESYEDSNVFLSLSGHFHYGQSAQDLNGVIYHTVPALCEAPFECSLIHIKGTEVEVEPIRLDIGVPDLSDVHCHTQYAYCGATVDAEKNLEVAKALGLSQLYLTEHAFHLYFDRQDAWSFNWQHQEELFNSGLNNPQSRMDEYKAMAFALRDKHPDFIKLALEVDMCLDGQLLLRDCDRTGWDLIVGAVHAIPDFIKGETSQQDAEKLFMRDVKKILTTGIDVLAHPFRFFRRGELEQPAHLYEEVASLLAEHGVAAEINYHTNSPSAEFIKICCKHGVKIAFGTDSHDIEEVGELYPHLKLMEAAGISIDEFPKVLFKK
jgi:histidinol phosphatase-like PHP family hydrolase/predicted MPP superfamily phosphohydrolase